MFPNPRSVVAFGIGHFLKRFSPVAAHSVNLLESDEFRLLKHRQFIFELV